MRLRRDLPASVFPAVLGVLVALGSLGLAVVILTQQLR
jgi:hypothetical protein